MYQQATLCTLLPLALPLIQELIPAASGVTESTGRLMFSTQPAGCRPDHACAEGRAAPGDSSPDRTRSAGRRGGDSGQGTALHYTALHYTAQHCTALHCTASASRTRVPAGGAGTLGREALGTGPCWGGEGRRGGPSPRNTEVNELDLFSDVT